METLNSKSNAKIANQIKNVKNSIFVCFPILCLCPSTNQALLVSPLVLFPCGTSQTGFSDAVSQERSQLVSKYATQGQGSWSPA